MRGARFWRSKWLVGAEVAILSLILLTIGAFQSGLFEDHDQGAVLFVVEMQPEGWETPINRSTLQAEAPALLAAIEGLEFGQQAEITGKADVDATIAFLTEETREPVSWRILVDGRAYQVDEPGPE